MKQRILYADLLKIIACVAVITIHATVPIIYREDISMNGWMTANFYSSISRWAVPIFVMVSGVFVFNFDLKKNLKMSLNTVRVLLVWSLIYFVANAMLKDKFYIFKLSFNDLKTFLNHLLNGSISPHLWYLYMLIGLYIVNIFIKKIIDNSSKKELLFLISILFINSIVIPTISNFKILFIYKTFVSKLYLNTFSCYSMYLLLGYYINKHNIKKIYRMVFYFLSVFNLFLTYHLTKYFSLIDGKLNVAFYRNSAINIFFVSLGLFLFFRNIVSDKINNKISKYSYYIVNKTFGIYLVHQLVLNVLSKLGINLKMFNVRYSTLIVVLICFGISFILTVLIEKNKILRKVLL